MRALPPYGKLLGISSVDDAPEPGTLLMPAISTLRGRPGFLHGGVIAGLLELACYEALHIELGDTEGVKIKPINVSVDFLRGGLMTDTFAVAKIVRIGQRIANAAAEVWQDDRGRLIATARMHLLLDRG
jgi:uncharacterized protein (TIGR00369 family)